MTTRAIDKRSDRDPMYLRKRQGNKPLFGKPYMELLEELDHNLR